jgi:hypothetical protein
VGVDRRWLRKISLALMIAAGVILAPCFLPILPPSRFVAYQSALHLPLPVRAEDYEKQTDFPGHLAWEFGWDEMVAAVAKVYYALPEDERSKAGILTDTYGEAGAVDLLGKKYGLPKAICGQLSYYDFGPRNYTGDVLIFIAIPDHLCRSVQYGATLKNPYGYSALRGPMINVCRGFYGDLQRDWPARKHY